MGSSVGIHSVERCKRPNASGYPTKYGNLQQQAQDARSYFALKHQGQPR